MIPTIRNFLRLLLPFFAAAAIGLCLRRPSVRLSKGIGISIRAATAILLFLLLTILALSVFFAAHYLFENGDRLFLILSEDAAAIGDSVSILFKKLSDSSLFEALNGIGILHVTPENIDDIISDALSGVAASLLKKLSGTALTILADLPSYFISVMVTAIAAFYFCVDYDKISATVIAKLNPTTYKRVRDFKVCLGIMLSRYLRSHVVLLTITLSLLFVGFLILRISDPLLIATIVSLVDLLPIVGVGAVLIPWGLIRMILYRDLYLGGGLLILYVITVITKQLAEPKIVGKGIGISPLLTLISTYVGLHLFGLIGMILAPVMTATVKSVFFDRTDIDKREAL